MPDKKQDLIDQKLQDLNNDGVDRRGFLKCMAWAGTGLVWTMSGGIPVSRAFAKSNGKDADKGADFSFVQISDSHIGFNEAGKSGCYRYSADWRLTRSMPCPTSRISSFTLVI